eukprot:CAMPEP_0176117366 /NCGR_PEP_ID=MMETSP0120_2-20121206/58961_1 /TAXON_ID=160619 /ORGANISM="Kryptoperidinium foliaceum, Strain CCMP 1326" /LENGTH=176 /DNA_ID=CAMNT_0017451655 /DNA_START=50 /DNA_END=580 /DNA_ORIENTATION=-
MSSSSNTGSNAADSKILNDLRALGEKMDLCQSMLNPGASDPKLSMQSDAMMSVVGFLEACAPRMVELVEAAATGALSEEVFAECLSSNDRLQKMLEDIDTAAMTESTAETTAASAPSSDDVTSQLDDLLLGEPLPTGGKTTGEGGEQDDSKQPAVGTASSNDDDFDAFFSERTSQS